MCYVNRVNSFNKTRQADIVKVTKLINCYNNLLNESKHLTMNILKIMVVGEDIIEIQNYIDVLLGLSSVELLLVNMIYNENTHICSNPK